MSVNKSPEIDFPDFFLCLTSLGEPIDSETQTSNELILLTASEEVAFSEKVACTS